MVRTIPGCGTGHPLPCPLVGWAGQSWPVPGEPLRQGLGVGGGPAPWLSMAPTSPSSLLFLCTPSK